MTGGTGSMPQPLEESPALLPLDHLESVWFQVTGFLCNLECTHCLVDSSPRNRSLSFLSREQIREYLVEAEALGVKEVYFTGGEPFLHPDLLGMLEDALAVAPTTVLTNGTLITGAVAQALGGLAAGSRYSLEVRVSIDHPDAVANDRVRGKGAHAKAIGALQRLEAAGLLPIVTATELLEVRPTDGEVSNTYETFLSALREAGVARPRLKVLPVFRIGKLEDPSSGGPVTPAMLEGADPLLLQCAGTRAVSANGVYACPILVGKEEALMSRGPLGEAMGAVRLSHHACRTCWETGMTCGNR